MRALLDINVIAPVFVGGEIVAYVANIAHHADVGGMVPGSEAAAHRCHAACVAVAAAAAGGARRATDSCCGCSIMLGVCDLGVCE